MIKLNTLALLAVVLAFAPEAILGHEINGQLESRDVHQKRAYDSYKVFERKRNAHACIMSIVFIVLFPLGAISIRLPIDRISFLRNTYLRNKAPAMHAPIQLLGFVMMVGGMALGIKIAQDLSYLQKPMHAHVVIGLLVCCTLILIQPIMGVLQHHHFKRTGGGRSIFGHIHRWVGRCAIILGIINNGLGFQLAWNTDVNVHNGTVIRNAAIAGILVLIWAALVALDTFATPRRTARDEGDKIMLRDQDVADQKAV